MTARTSETLGEIAKALAIAQAAFGEVKKAHTAKVKGETKDGRKYDYEYHYADLTDVLEAIRKPLSENGLALVQPMAFTEGQRVLVTRLVHSSGEWIESVYPLNGYSRPQDMGSEITYARRYALTALLGIAAEVDDDGQAAQNSSSKPKAAPKRDAVPLRDAWYQAGRAAGLTDDELKTYLEVEWDASTRSELDDDKLKLDIGTFNTAKADAKVLEGLRKKIREGAQAKQTASVGTDTAAEPASPPKSRAAEIAASIKKGA